MIDGPGDPGQSNVALCESDARAAVARAKLIGYDFIKVYSRLQPDVYAAVLDEAKRQNIAAVGHIPTAVGLEKSLAQGQVMIAHARNTTKRIFRTNRTMRAFRGQSNSHAALAPTSLRTCRSLPLLPMRCRSATMDRRMAEPDIEFLPPERAGKLVSCRPAKASDRCPGVGDFEELTRALSRPACHS